MRPDKPTPDGAAAEGCPACGHTGATCVFRSQLAWSVRSDWAPVAIPAEVFACEHCGHLHKETSSVLEGADYEAYSAWDNDPRGDKLDHLAEVPMARSERLREHLLSTGVLGPDQRLLDFGCNRGAFLRLLPPGHGGLEVSEQYREQIEAQGHRFYTPASPPPDATFDVLSLLHVLEHLLEPPRDLKAGLSALQGEGRVVVQVPDVLTQPTDLYVIDHRSHFCQATLDACMRRMGRTPLMATHSLIRGELTGIYVDGATAGSAPRDALSRGQIDAAVHMLQRGESLLADLASSARTYRVYGAGLLGGLVASVLGERAIDFIDDDPARAGSTFLERSVTPWPSDGGGAPVVVAVPPTAASRVATRCRQAGTETFVPFPLAV